MDLEYIRRGHTNRRFRVVINNRSDQQFIPTGWAHNTIIYQFPDMFTELTERVFK